jgi:hypothetical protein
MPLAGGTGGPLAAISAALLGAAPATLLATSAEVCPCTGWTLLAASLLARSTMIETTMATNSARMPRMMNNGMLFTLRTPVTMRGLSRRQLRPARLRATFQDQT